MEVSELRVNITGNDSQLAASLTGAKAKVNAFSGGATGALGRLTAANNNVAGSAGRMAGAYDIAAGSVARAARNFLAFTVITAGLRSASVTLADFEQSMAQVAAITRATSPELASMRKVAENLGATTEFTASQAAEGLKYLGMAGFTASQSMQAIPAVLNLATAASMDLGSAADITSNIMSGFGIQAAKASSVADVLAAAASRLNTDVMQLGDAMKYVGPVAAAFNISMNDAAAAIGVLSNAGIQGDMAGTGLRKVLSSLANPTADARKVIAAMGLTIADLNPKTHSLVQLIDTLAKTGLSASAALKIFGDRGGPAILALTRNAGSLEQLTSELSDVNGEALRMATTMRDNLMGDWHNFVSAVQAVIIALGENGATSVLRAFLEAATAGFRTLADYMPEIAHQVTAVGIALGIAFGPQILASAVALTAAIGTGLVDAIYALDTAMLTNPLTAIPTAIALALVALYEFRDEINSVFGVDIVQDATSAGNYIIAAFQSAYDEAKFFWNDFPLFLSKTFIDAVNVVIDAVNRMIGALKAGVNEVVGLLNHIPGVNVGGVGPGNGSIPQIDNTYAAKSNAAVKALVDQIHANFQTDYLGFVGGGSAYQGAGPGRHASSGGGYGITPTVAGAEGIDASNIGSGGSKAENHYKKLIQSANSYIASQSAERQAIGMTDVAAASLQHTQDLLNKAKQEGIKLTPTQTAELKSLGDQMGAAEIATKKLQDAYDTVKSGVKGFLSSFTSAIEQGKSLWQAFGEAAQSVLDKIISKIEDQLSTAITDALFKGQSSTGGGGLFSSLLGGLGSIFGGVSPTSSLWAPNTTFGAFIGANANGTDNWRGGLTWVGERGPEIVNLPRGSQVIPNHRIAQAANQNSGPSEIHVYFHNTVDANGNIVPVVEKISEQKAGAVTGKALQNYDRNVLPHRVNFIKQNPRQVG